MIQAQVQSTANGAILTDAALVPRAGESWFDPAAWLSPGGMETPRGGRGSVAFIELPIGACVLRHYRRGGFIARLSADRYMWIGASRTRGFREFRLLARLVAAELRVPVPVAARYEREGLRYRADLITRRIAGAHTLAERLSDGNLDAALAARVGATLARFHAFGACHADLNAHNVLSDLAGEIWLLDFDRGRIRRPALAWQQANLARLNRSFDKLGARRKLDDFDVRFWHPLLAAYHAGLAGDARVRSARR